VAAAAKGVCLFEDHVEHRLKIARRGIDHLQDLGHRALAGQRLVALAAKVSYGLLRIG